MFPENTLLFALAEQVLKIGAAVHILTDHSDPIGVVHRFVKVISVKLEHVRMCLHLKKLDRFFLRE